MDIFPEVDIVPPLPHEKVLRLAVTRIRSGYKPGWLYFKCKEAGLLDIFKRYQESGYFELLERGPAGQTHAAKLTIELVPRSCWFDNVRSNVTTEDWQRLKKITSRKANRRCQICGGQGPRWPVECHEVWHYDDERLIQSLQDLVALCPSCHEVKHIGLTELKGKTIEATAHLAIVNGWSYSAAEKCVEEAFEAWESRSSKTWTLDISWLKRQGISINQLNQPQPAGVDDEVVDDGAVSPDGESSLACATSRKRPQQRIRVWWQRLFAMFSPR